MKERGILLPIFSLPSKYGIGDFGYEAYEFIDILSENGIDFWEILPINACNRLPYSPLSYYALQEDYISIDKLGEMRLIKEAELRKNTQRAIYDDFKQKYYEEAFGNFVANDEYNRFVQRKEIKQYAEFMSKNSGKAEEYYLFLQYILHKQWSELKEYANSRNVKIIGDMPMYPVFNSVETTFNSECFEMENGSYKFEAGTPPDYYNSEGQKWNCPVYNVENLAKQNYKYLVERFKYYLELFDKVRVDYFRGYDSFYKIPYGKTGKEGFYSDGVSYAFFDELFKDGSVNRENLIIEDLGDIRQETVLLREHYGFTRQKILQFAIDFDNKRDLDNESENVLMFPGNHDCATIVGWYKNLDEDKKIKLKEFLNANGCDTNCISDGIIQYCMKCKARIVIVTVQDILGLDDDSRINLPGVDSKNNWSWKLLNFDELKRKISVFK